MVSLLYLLPAAWAAYCAARVVAAPRQAVQVGTEVAARCPCDFAYQTYLGVRHFYLRLSPGHQKYEMQGEPLGPDTVIHIWERAGFQQVRHQYQVAENVPGRLMRLVSPASQVRVLGLFRGQTRSEVAFRFTAAGPQACRLGLTICIVFPNRLRHLLARVVFTQAIWQRHAEQEMAALARWVGREWDAQLEDERTVAISQAA